MLNEIWISFIAKAINWILQLLMLGFESILNTFEVSLALFWLPYSSLIEKILDICRFWFYRISNLGQFLGDLALILNDIWTVLTCKAFNRILELLHLGFKWIRYTFKLILALTVLLFSNLVQKSLQVCLFCLVRHLDDFDRSFHLLESNFIRVMEALHNLDLAIELLDERAAFFSILLRILIGLDDRNDWLQIREISQFQAKVSIPMMLREVFEALAVIALDSDLILLINDVFWDVRKVLWIHEDLLKFEVLAVYFIDQIYKAICFDSFELCH